MRIRYFDVLDHYEVMEALVLEEVGNCIQFVRLPEALEVVVPAKFQAQPYTYEDLGKGMETDERQWFQLED